MATTPQRYDWQADSAKTITSDSGTEYPADIYTRTSKRVLGRQQQVADEWARGKLPLDAPTYTGGKPTLVSSSGNFSGEQRPDGSGRLIHYSTTQAIRTVGQKIICNTECWSKGFAKCNTPSTGIGVRTTSLPLSQIEVEAVSSREHQPRYIRDVVSGGRQDDDGYDLLIVFENGDAFRATRDMFEHYPLDDSDVQPYLADINAGGQ